MGILDKLKEKAIEAAEKRVDQILDAVAALPPETVWAAVAEMEKGDFEVHGLLSHDGHNVTFTSWKGNRDFTVPASAITHRRGEARVRHGKIKCDLDDVKPISQILPTVELPACAKVEDLERPMYGFFSTLGIPV